MDVQKWIMPFIYNELDLKELEMFIHHIHSCPDCREELEVYYVLVSGMRQLDEDKELSMDFHKDLMDLLNESEERVLQGKFLKIRKRIVLFFMITAVAVISSIRIGEIVIEDAISKERASREVVNRILLSHNPLLSEEEIVELFPSELREEIKKNLPQIYYYILMRDKEGAVRLEERFKDKIFEFNWIPKA